MYSKLSFSSKTCCGVSPHSHMMHTAFSPVYSLSAVILLKPFALWEFQTRSVFSFLITSETDCERCSHPPGFTEVSELNALIQRCLSLQLVVFKKSGERKSCINNVSQSGGLKELLQNRGCSPSLTLYSKVMKRM